MSFPTKRQTSSRNSLRNYIYSQVPTIFEMYLFYRGVNFQPMANFNSTRGGQKQFSTGFSYLGQTKPYLLTATLTRTMARPQDKVVTNLSLITGSTTKAFVSAAMSLLVDDNEKHPNLNWTTPVSSLIRDDFVLQDEYVTNHVTIEDILSHRTGMGAYTMSYGGTHNGHREMPRDVVRSLRHLPLTAELRTTFQYCNLMFVVASHIIETLERVWLGDFLRERIWERESPILRVLLALFVQSRE